MPAYFNIKTGGMIRLTIFPLAVVPPLVSLIPLIGTSTNLTVSNMPVCLEGDELPPVLMAPLPDIEPPFVTPGTGTVSVTLPPMNKTILTENGKAIFIKGTPFMAEFQLIAPAMQPTSVSTVPDLVAKKLSMAEFVTTNVMVKEG